MIYAIIEVINGSFFVRAEGITTISAAKVQYRGRCQTLWNASDVADAYVMIVDTQLDVVEGYKEYIHHDPQPTPEPAPPENTEGE